MSGRKDVGLMVILVLSACLISASFIIVLMANYYHRTVFQLLGDVCQNVIEQQPEAEGAATAALKRYRDSQADGTEENILSAWGFRQSDFLKSTQRNNVFLAAAGFIAGVFLFLSVFWCWRRKEMLRVKALTDYLEKVNTGNPGLVLQNEEGEFSKLQDEMYKTVTMLYQTRDDALKAKTNFAENLSNIAHQLKTPITSISLSAQMMKEHPAIEYAEQIQRQLKRLAYLEEALLLLSRLDAGTLFLELKSVDVFTVLTLASDNLHELFRESGVSVDIPEMGEALITADVEWTMEAVMNLLKNCMEHTPPGGVVHCSYEQNPLYTQILIWDEGCGFAVEDLPRLFERFYRGRNAGGGIGIGLSLARAIIESQNGMLSAANIPDGGACFEIRIYSH